MDVELFNQLPTDTLRYLYEQHNLYFHPAGVWQWDKVDSSHYKKLAIDARRNDSLPWAGQYKADNLAKIRLPRGVLVLDIDKAKTTITGDTMHIPALDIEIPLGLYTQTSSEGSYHIYYSTTDLDRNQIGSRMIKGLHGLKIDVLQNFNCFEGHDSPLQFISKGDLLPIPTSLLSSISEYVVESQLPKHLSMALHLQSNPGRAYLVKLYLDGKIDTRKDMNALIKGVVPSEFLPPEGKRQKMAWASFKFDYDFINKTAVKLTTTKELGFYEHTLPMLNKMLEEFGLSPTSAKTHQRLHGQILPSLPSHPVIEPYNSDNDDRTLLELARSQPSGMAIFKVTHKDKRKYIAVDKITLESISYQEDGSPFMDALVIEDIAPEWCAIREDGSTGPLDHRDIPMVLYVIDPYKPPYYFDEDKYRHTINLSTRSKYIKAVEPIAIPEDNNSNFIMNTMRSTVPPAYLDLILWWHTEIIFGNVPPQTVVWMATDTSVLGGTGKSMVTATILDRILAGGAATASVKDFNSGWAIPRGVRYVSLDEGDGSSKAEFISTHNRIKKLSSANHSISNDKSGAFSNRVNLLGMGGSSNSLPPLPGTDRRLLCLEPGHTGPNPLTRRISDSDAALLDKFDRDHTGVFSKEIQEYTNHLYYKKVKGIPKDIHKALYAFAPKTPYRQKWIVDGSANSKATFILIPEPDEFWALIKFDRIVDDLQKQKLVMLIQYILHMHSISAQKVELSWAWFKEILHYTMGNPETELAKRDIVKYTGATFSTPSGWAKELHNKWKASHHVDWPGQVVAVRISDEAIDRYREILIEYTGKIVAKPLNDGLDL